MLELASGAKKKKSIMNRLKRQSTTEINFIKTSIIQHNCNPEWEDVIQVKVLVKNQNDMEGIHVLLSVWDSDFGTQDDLIGLLFIY